MPEAIENRLKSTKPAAALSRSPTMLLPMPLAVVRDLSIRYHLTLNALCSGHGTRAMMVTMAEVMCVAYFLWRDGYGKAAIVSWEPVQAALAYRDQVGRDTGLWAFDDNAYALLCNVLMLHDQQLGATPLYALKKANDQLQQHAAKAAGQDPASMLTD